MSYTITFTTSKFDVSKEDKNPINPIYGQSLLLWLKEKAGKVIQMEDPDTEDWGWYSYALVEGRKYLIGASSEQDDSPNRDWILQISKHRSMMEKILGKEKMTPDDKCFLYLKSLIESEPEFQNIVVNDFIK